MTSVQKKRAEKACVAAHKRLRDAEDAWLEAFGVLEGIAADPPTLELIAALRNYKAAFQMLVALDEQEENARLNG